MRGTVTAPADGIPASAVGRHFDFAEADAFEVEIIDAGIETLNQSWAVMKKKSVELTADGLLKEKPRRWWRRG